MDYLHYYTGRDSVETGGTYDPNYLMPFQGEIENQDKISKKTLDELENSLQQNRITVDGWHYNGATGLTGYEYSVKQISKDLQAKHDLSEEKALEVINALDVDFFVPLQHLLSISDKDYPLVESKDRNAEVSLTLKDPKAFKIEATKYFELPQTDVKICVIYKRSISKSGNAADNNGKWTWEVINQGSARGKIEQYNQLPESVKKLVREHGTTFVTENGVALEEKDGQFKTSEKIIKQLKDVRYEQIITVDGKVWEGPEVLYAQLISKGYSKGRAVEILNQIEIQSFATPLASATPILISNGLHFIHDTKNTTQNTQINVSLKDQNVVVSGTAFLSLCEETQKVGKIILNYEITNPLREDNKTGSYQCRLDLFS